VDDLTEAIASLHRSSRQRDHVGRLTGSTLLDPLVRTGLVVVVDELHGSSLRPIWWSPFRDHQAVSNNVNATALGWAVKDQRTHPLEFLDAVSRPV